MSSLRALLAAALSVLLLCATSSLAQNSTDEVWFGAAVLRGSYLHPQALGIALFGQSSRSGEVRVFVQILGLPDGVSPQSPEHTASDRRASCPHALTAVSPPAVRAACAAVLRARSLSNTRCTCTTGAT